MFSLALSMEIFYTLELKNISNLIVTIKHCLVLQDQCNTFFSFFKGSFSLKRLPFWVTYFRETIFSACLQRQLYEYPTVLSEKIPKDGLITRIDVPF